MAYIACASRLAKRARRDGIVQLGDFGFWPEESNWPHTQPTELDHDWLDAIASALRSVEVWMRVIDGNHDAQLLAREAFGADHNGVRPVRDRVLD